MARIVQISPPDRFLEPRDGFGSRGVEDARIVELDHFFYMTYTAYSREFDGPPKGSVRGGGLLSMIAHSHNLVNWERLGAFVSGEDCQ